MDLQAKAQRIDKIDDEVRQLHPLLNLFLHNLPSVKYVEYTHGPNEMGADFVLERHDEVLSETYHVGVIVKCDKILQQFGDVERQIDECGVPRLIRQGKQTVRLSEVWIITSKSISQNAKTKISEKYANRKVHFFDSDWLIRKIDEHAAYYWDELKGTIGTYLSSLDKRVTVINTQTSFIQTTQSAATSIELDVEEVDTDRYNKSSTRHKPRLINLREEVLNNKITLLEASMGFGKSHTARQIVSHFADTEVYKKTSAIPIYLPFKNYLDQDTNDADVFIRATIGEQCYKDCRDDQASFLLILDGIDEASNDLEKCAEVLEALTNSIRNHPHIRLLLTSRPLKVFNEVAIFKSTTKNYRIRPLSVSKIINYLQAVIQNQQLPKKLIADLAKSGLFKQLPQNPIAASLLANIINQKIHELPSTLTELYSKTMELMLGRWDERRSISTEKQYKATERLTRHLARHMIDNQLIYMSKSEVRQMFESFLAERNIGVPVEEVFDYLINRSNLIGCLEDTDALFFRHRSFAEYLYALDAYELRDLDINEKAFHPYWVNVFFFYLGTLGESPAGIKKLVQLSPNGEQERFLRMLNMGNYMLAAYQTPYAVVEEALDVVLLDAARLYLDIKYGRIKSKLIDLTEMQLLWFIAMSLRHCYGYTFFEKALPLAMAKIDDSLLDDEEAKIYALFFAASALGEVDNTCGFEFLLAKKKVNELPIAISLALRCEIEYSSKEFVSSAIVKQYEKRLFKLLKFDSASKLSTQAKLNALFEQPLSNKIESAQKISHSSRASAKKQNGNGHGK